MNPYTPYYSDQIATGISGFQGTRTQRGHGFFGRLFSGITGFIKDIIPSLGKKALPSAIGLAQDIISGENVAKSAKNRLKEAGKNVAHETLDQLKTKLQKGKGINNLKSNLKNRGSFFNVYNTRSNSRKKKKKIKKNKNKKVNKRNKKRKRSNKK